MPTPKRLSLRIFRSNSGVLALSALSRATIPPNPLPICLTGALLRVLKTATLRPMDST